MEVEDGKGVIEGLVDELAGKVLTLLFWGDDDLEFSTAVDLVSLNEFNQTNEILCSILGNETPFGIIMDMLNPSCDL